jgi:hypothetical protein
LYTSPDVIKSDQIKEDEKGVTCSTHGRHEKYIRPRFWLENLYGRDHLEELGVDGKIILEYILGK